jgi:hypothetical protein
VESLSASVAVLTPPAVAYSPQDVRNCTVVGYKLQYPGMTPFQHVIAN